MVIYIDRLLALNALINYLLLAATAQLCGQPRPRRRLLFAALLGALYALLALLPKMQLLGMLTIKLLCAAVMAAAAFGLSRQLLRQWLLLLALSALYSGVVLAVQSILGGSVTLIGGVAYYPVQFRVLLLTAGLLWLLLSAVFSRLGAHSGSDFVTMSLTAGGNTIHVRALHDTGNSLCDPLSGQHVPVVEWAVLQPMFPTAPRQLPADPIRALETLRSVCPTLRPRLLPYRTVANRGLLPAICCECLVLGQHSRSNALVAISTQAVSDNGTFHALTGGIHP